MKETQTPWSKKWNLVISKGQKKKDKRVIYDFFLDHKITSDFLSKCSIPFLQQLRRDANVDYKFYDALGMWIGQREVWSKDDLEVIREFVDLYLNEEDY